MALLEWPRAFGPPGRRSKMNITRSKRKGFALIFVLLIAAAMMIPVLMLLSSTAPRRAKVSGEAVSDRVLSLADATVDKILAQINTFPSVVFTDSALTTGFNYIVTYYSDNPPSGDSDNKKAKTVISKYAMAYLLSFLNGGTVDLPSNTSGDPQVPLQANVDVYPGASHITAKSLWDIEDNVSTYLYDLTNQQYYAVVDSTGKIAPVLNVGISGDIQTKSIKNLSTGVIDNGTATAGIGSWDSNYATDNRWVEVDTNTQYQDDGTDSAQSTMFEMRVSAYPVTNSGAKNIARNILAEASLQPLNVTVGSSDTESGPYDKALWSGHGLTINGSATVAAADTLKQALTGDYVSGGDIYADGKVSLKAGGISIGGSVMTSQAPNADPKKDPIIINQNATFGGRVYSQEESLPDFPTGTESNVKADAIAAGEYFSAGYAAKNATLAVNGGSWYIDGSTTLDGTTINFGSDLNVPGTIWVNGDITFKSGTTVQGQGKIVANGKITFQGKSSGLAYTDATSKVAIISEGVDSAGGIDMQGDQNFMGLFYAPHNNITIGGNSSIFGSVIAGGYISVTGDGLTISGAKNTFVYDTRWGPNQNGLPGQLEAKGVEFTGSTIYRFSWREVISKPVTELNIQALTPQFVFMH